MKLNFRARFFRVSHAVVMATLGAVTRLTTSIRTLSGLTFLAQRFASTDTLSPRRSLLYIPGNDERKIKKATTLKANTIVLDCEDGVAFNRKVQKWG